MQGERRGGGGTYIIYGASRLYTCVLGADAHTNLMPTLSHTHTHFFSSNRQGCRWKWREGEREGRKGRMKAYTRRRDR